MNTRHENQFRWALAGVFTCVVLALFAFNKPTAIAEEGKSNAPKKGIEKVVKSDADWRKILTKEQYRVVRKKGTERAFTGTYWNNKEKGVYHCVACDLPLFSSETKFRSGTGWPSYYQPIKKENVGEKKDRSFFMTRIEVICNRCDGHLGHVFDDGPRPTGLRYCINSASLKFKKDSATDGNPAAK